MIESNLDYGADSHVDKMTPECHLELLDRSRASAMTRRDLMHSQVLKTSDDLRNLICVLIF